MERGIQLYKPSSRDEQSSASGRHFHSNSRQMMEMSNRPQEVVVNHMESWASSQKMAAYQYLQEKQRKMS